MAEINIGFNEPVEKGAPIFRLDSSKQEAAVESARRKIAEVDAEMVVARADVVEADGQMWRPRARYQQVVDELETKQELYRRDPDNVPLREIERLQSVVEGLLGAITAATAAKQGIEERISALLPAEKASAEAALAQAQVELDKTVVHAGVNGRVEQFTLRVGDVVNPMMRPAGRPYSCWGRPADFAGGLRPDRGADHEGRNDRRSHLRLETVQGHPDGGDGSCRTTLPPASSGPVTS